MKIVFILAGILLMLVGLVLVGVGALWSGPDGALAGPLSGEQFVRLHILPMVEPIVRDFIAFTSQEVLDFVFFGQYGLLTTVGVLGILVFLSGGAMVRNPPKGGPSRAVIRKDKNKVKGEVQRREAAKKAAAEAAGKAAPAAAGGKKGPTVSIADEEKLLGGAEKIGMFDDMDEEEKTSQMVSLFHTSLDKDQCDELLMLFRPKLADFKEIYRDDALSMLTKQALELEIIRRRRQQEDISPDQFRTFDDKITELDQESVCYRYLPSNPDAAPKEARRYFGLVYDRFNHSAVQQKLRSDAEDWRPVSLRNAVEILSAKAPEREPDESDPSDSEKSAA